MERVSKCPAAATDRRACCSEDPGRGVHQTEGPGDSEQRVVQLLSGDNGSFPESSAFMEEERVKNYIFDIFGKILMLVLFIYFYLFGIYVYVCICLCEDHRGGLNTPLPLCALNP